MAAFTGTTGKPLTNRVDPKLNGRDLSVRSEVPHSHPGTVEIPKQTYPKGQRKALGVAQVMLGLVFITFGIPLIQSPQSFAAEIGTPWWGGVVFMISGITSIAAERKLNRIVLWTCTVFNLLSASVALGVFLLLSVDLRQWVPYLACLNRTPCESYEFALSESQFSLRIILLIFAMMELAISIATLTIGWKEVWGCSGTNKTKLPKDLSNPDTTYESLFFHDPTYTPMSAIKKLEISMVAK